MLTFDDAQRDVFRDDMLNRFRSDMRAHVTAFAPERIEAAGADGLARFVDLRIDDSMKRGLRLRGPVRSWLELSVVLGAAFDSDPQHAGLIPDLDPAEWPMPFAERLHANALAYITACFGPDRAIVGRVIGETLARDIPETGDVETFLVDIVHDIWPERIAHAGDGPIRALAPAAEQAASDAGLTSPRGRLLAATLCLSFGAGVMADPLYPFLHARLAEDAPEDERIARTLKGLRIYARRMADRYPTGG